MSRTVRVGEGSAEVAFANGAPLALIAGPCVIESNDHVLRMAKAIRDIVGPFVFKASSIKPIEVA